MATDLGELRAKVTMDGTQSTTSLKDIATSLRNLQDMIVATFIVKGLGAIKDFAQSLLDLGTQAAQTGRTQDIFNKEFTDSSKAMDELTKATAGTISKMDLMTMSNQAFGKGLKLSAADTGKLFAVARIEAIKTGSTTEAIMSTIENALRTGMIKPLKDLGFNFKDTFGKVTTEVTKAGKAVGSTAGITTTSKTVVDKYGVAHQVTSTHVNKHTKALKGHAATTKEVTKNVGATMKAEELLSLVLDESGGILADNKNLNNDNASSLERLSAVVDNLKTGFLELVNRGLSVLLGILKPMQPLVDEIGRLLGILISTIMTSGVGSTIKDVGTNLKEAFTDAVRNTLRDVAQHIIDLINYLKTPAGKQALSDFSTHLKTIGVTIAGLISLIPSIISFFMNLAGSIAKADANVLSFISKVEDALALVGNLLGLGDSGSSLGGGIVIPSLGKAFGSGHAVGSDYIPRDMLTLVHQGEQIIPANKVDSRNSGGGMSGASITNYMTFRDPSEYESYNRNLRVQLKI